MINLRITGRGRRLSSLPFGIWICPHKKSWTCFQNGLDHNQLLKQEESEQLISTTLGEVSTWCGSDWRKTPIQPSGEVSVASKFKRDNSVPYPPFSFFVSFVSEEAKIRNNPSFACVTTFSLRTEKPAGPKQKYQSLSGKRMCHQQVELVKILPLTRASWTLINSVPCIVNRTQ